METAENGPFLPPQNSKDAEQKETRDSPRQFDDGEFTHVQVERMDDGTEVRKSIYIQGFGLNGVPMAKPPVVATWICLILAWLFLGSSIPFTVFIGIPLDFAALFLAVVCLTRGGFTTGLLVLLLGTVGSLMVYMVGLFKFFAAM